MENPNIKWMRSIKLAYINDRNIHCHKIPSINSILMINENWGLPPWLWKPLFINHCPGDPPCIDLCCYAGGCPQTIRWLKDRSDDRKFPSHRIETHDYR